MYQFHFPVAEVNPNLPNPIENNTIARQIISTFSAASSSIFKFSSDLNNYIVNLPFSNTRIALPKTFLSLTQKEIDAMNDKQNSTALDCGFFEAKTLKDNLFGLSFKSPGVCSTDLTFPNLNRSEYQISATDFCDNAAAKTSGIKKCKVTQVSKTKTIAILYKFIPDYFIQDSNALSYVWYVEFFGDSSKKLIFYLNDGNRNTFKSGEFEALVNGLEKGNVPNGYENFIEDKNTINSLVTNLSK